MAKKKTPEQYIQSAIFDYLKVCRVWCLRQQTGMLRNPAGRPVAFGTPGCADILASFQGRFLWLEVKADTDQTQEQKSFQTWVENAGHTYVVVRSVDDVKNVLNELTNGDA